MHRLYFTLKVADMSLSESGHLVLHGANTWRPPCRRTLNQSMSPGESNCGNPLATPLGVRVIVKKVPQVLVCMDGL